VKFETLRHHLPSVCPGLQKYIPTLRPQIYPLWKKCNPRNNIPPQECDYRTLTPAERQVLKIEELVGFRFVSPSDYNNRSSSRPSTRPELQYQVKMCNKDQQPQWISNSFLLNTSARGRNLARQ